MTSRIRARIYRPNFRENKPKTLLSNIENERSRKLGLLIRALDSGSEYQIHPRRINFGWEEDYIGQKIVLSFFEEFNQSNK
jgi:hypothetical protein